MLGVGELRLGNLNRRTARGQFRSHGAIINGEQRITRLHVAADLDEDLGDDSGDRGADEILPVLASTMPEPATDLEYGDSGASATGVANGGDLSPRMTANTAKPTPASASNGTMYLRNMSPPMCYFAVRSNGLADSRSE